MRVLLKKGAKVNTQNYLGKTALHHAVRNLHAGHIRILIEHHCDVNLQVGENTCIQTPGPLPQGQNIQSFIVELIEISLSRTQSNVFLFFFTCMFYQLLHVQHSCSSTQSWGSVLPSIVETRDQNSRDCPLLFSNRNLGSFCA